MFCWQSDICFLLLWHLTYSLQHVPAEVSNDSLFLNNTHYRLHEKSVQACSCSFLIRKKGKKIFQKLKRRAGGFPNQKGESVPALESVAHSELSNLALGLTKEVSGEEEEAESRDMAEAERELDGSPLGVLSEASVGVLSSAATFCCGGQEVASKLRPGETEKSSVKSETAGTHVDRDPSERSLIFFFSFSLPQFSPFSSVYFQCPGGHQQPVPAVWCSCGCGFSRLQERKRAQGAFS